jgi:hypothetical protein
MEQKCCHPEPSAKYRCHAERSEEEPKNLLLFRFFGLIANLLTSYRLQEQAR